MANKSGRLAALLPAAANAIEQLYTPAAGNRAVGTLRINNQSGATQAVAYAITAAGTPPAATVDKDWYISGLDVGVVPFAESVVVGAGQCVWVRSSSPSVAFQLNGLENQDT